MTEVVCVGLNHKSAPVELREKVAFRAEALPQHLAALCGIGGVNEMVVLSTCNRVELYASVTGPEVASAITRYLHTSHGLAPDTLTNHLYTHAGDEAVRHLFRVASSLDAVVVGEPQILGQVKDAFRTAVETAHVGPALSKLFHRAFTVAKRVRTETGIAQNAVSVSFAAVEMAKQLYGSVRGKICVLVGAGNMGELAARHFAQEGAELWVVNRSFERAEALAVQFGGTARSFSDLTLLLEKAHVVLTSTAAQGYLVTREMMKPVMKARRYEPISFIDIAVPRNVDPDLSRLENVYVYDVDDLDRVVDENKEKRQQEARKADTLVAEEVGAWRDWWAAQAVVPTIKALRARASALVEAEVKKTLSGLGESITDKERKSIAAMANAVVNKLLHEPLATLKDTQGDNVELASATRRLFHLEVDESAPPPAGPGDNGAGGQEALAALREAEAAEQATTGTPA